MVRCGVFRCRSRCSSGAHAPSHRRRQPARRDRGSWGARVPGWAIRLMEVGGTSSSYRAAQENGGDACGGVGSPHREMRSRPCERCWRCPTLGILMRGRRSRISSCAGLSTAARRRFWLRRGNGRAQRDNPERPCPLRPGAAYGPAVPEACRPGDQAADTGGAAYGVERGDRAADHHVQSRGVPSCVPDRGVARSPRFRPDGPVSPTLGRTSGACRCSGSGCVR
jgi:hypothetical protein